jgi:hypothetical protein
MKRRLTKPVRGGPSHGATRPASKGRRDFTKWGFLIALLSWLFPDPLSRLFSPRVPEQKTVASGDSLSIKAQESVPVGESIVLTPEPARLTISVAPPAVVVATASQTNANAF